MLNSRRGLEVKTSDPYPFLVQTFTAQSLFSQRREIISQLPNHLQCVLPSEGDSNNTLSLAQMEDAVRLLLKYEDCFVGASGKVGWTDHSFRVIRVAGHAICSLQRPSHV